jgi:hypothetical protein
MPPQNISSSASPERGAERGAVSWYGGGIIDDDDDDDDDDDF